MKTRILAVVSAFSFLLCACESVHVLYDGQEARYSIVLPESASRSERTAAKELQETLQKMGGPELEITSDASREYRIFVGVAPKGKVKPVPDDESFCYCTKGKDLYIFGGEGRGTMYGVFRFMEQELGVRYYTPECTVFPEMERCTFGRLSVTGSPALSYRQLDYFHLSGHPEWLAHNCVNTNGGPSDNEWGGLESYSGCHTMPYYVPDSLFKDHPEYFALRDGSRQTGQLCLSNPDVLQMCKEGVLNTMRFNHSPRIYSLSQADDTLYCQCPECRKIEAQYGGQHSGIMLWFVNQVADYVRDEFPDKYVGTFAYQYTRTPPEGIVPRDNVVVRLCSIECCFAHPFTAGCPENEPFMRDLRTWGEIAPHLFIWDYVVDYAQYLAPWPNFQVLAQNLRTMRDNHAIGVYEESCYDAGGSEFCDMKAWVLAHLLWNPDQEVDTLVNDFINGYYGCAAQYVREYYDMCQGLVTPDVHFGIYIGAGHEIYSDEFIDKADLVLRKARDAAENDEIRDRVDKVRMQILYLHAERRFHLASKDGSWEELKSLARRYHARWHEGMPLEQSIANQEAFLK